MYFFTVNASDTHTHTHTHTCFDEEGNACAHAHSTHRQSRLTRRFSLSLYRYIALK